MSEAQQMNPSSPPHWSPIFLDNKTLQNFCAVHMTQIYLPIGVWRPSQQYTEHDRQHLYMSCLMNRYCRGMPDAYEHTFQQHDQLPEDITTGWSEQINEGK